MLHVLCRNNHICIKRQKKKTNDPTDDLVRVTSTGTPRISSAQHDKSISRGTISKILRSGVFVSEFSTLYYCFIRSMTLARYILSRSSSHFTVIIMANRKNNNDGIHLIYGRLLCFIFLRCTNSIESAQYFVTKPTLSLISHFDNRTKLHGFVSTIIFLLSLSIT